MAVAHLRAANLKRRYLPAALVLLGATGLSSLAEARPGVVVAEFTDASGRNLADKARTQIVRALAEADALDLVPYAKVKSIAAARRVRPAELLTKPHVLGRMAHMAGAQIAVAGAIGRDLKINIRIYDRNGAELWSKAVPLVRMELPASIAQRYAAAIAAAVGAEPAQKRPPEPPPQAEPERRPEPKRDPETEPEVVETSGTRPGPDDEPIAPIPEPTRKPKRPPGPEDEPDAELPLAETEPRDLPRPYWAQLSLNFTTTWRTYQFCPEVADCGESPPPGFSPVKYTTNQPYGSFFLRVDGFPLRFLDNFVRGLGLSFTYGRSLFLKTRYKDADAGDQVFSSTQQRIAVELVYRFYYRIDAMGDGWIGLRGGYLNHAFFVDENPIIVESRRAGLYGAIDASLPLHRFVRIEARAMLVPLASPGATERAEYGVGDDVNDRPTQGGGWSIEGGLTSDLGHPEWHVGVEAMFEYAHFGDRYNNPPDTPPEFGRALENYVGFRIGLRTFL